MSYTGATLAPGQVTTIIVGSNGGFDRQIWTMRSPGRDYTSLGTTLTFTAGGPNSQTVAVSTIHDTVVEGTEDYTVTIGGQTAGTISTSQANTIISTTATARS